MTVTWKETKKNTHVVLDFDIKDNVIDVKDLKDVVEKAPAVDNTLGVCISGRGPVWLFSALTEKYHPTAFVSTNDPRLGGCVVTARHVKEVKGTKIDIGTILAEFPDDDHPMCQHDPGTTGIDHSYDESITRIPACMSKYKNLERLDLSRTDVRKIENLDKNVKLESLDLGDTKVSQIENLDNNVKLEYLGLSRTDVSRIENLDKNVKLEYLWLNGTKVSQIENLDNLVNLKDLNLGGTKVPDEEKRAFKASRPGLRVS